MQRSHATMIRKLQERIGNGCLGASSLRNQGAKDMIKTARDYMKHIDLQQFAAATSKQAFCAALDQHTLRLAARFPKGGTGNWGAARKALNLFLRDACYHTHLQRHYRLQKLWPLLELPLDSYCFDWIKKDAAACGIAYTHLPKKPTIKRLTQAQSEEFQKTAQRIARYHGLDRIDLDIFYWRAEA